MVLKHFLFCVFFVRNLIFPQLTVYAAYFFGVIKIVRLSHLVVFVSVFIDCFKIVFQRLIDFALSFRQLSILFGKRGSGGCLFSFYFLVGLADLRAFYRFFGCLADCDSEHPMVAHQILKHLLLLFV